MKSRFIFGFAVAFAIFASMLGGVEYNTAYAETYTRNELLDLDDTAKMRRAGFVQQTKYAKFGFDHSVVWRPDAVEYCEYWFEGNQDWSDYSGALLTLHSAKATNKYVQFRWMSGSNYNSKSFYIDWEGWNTIYVPFGTTIRDAVCYIRFGANSTTDGIYGTELTVSSIRMVKMGEYDFYDSAFGYEVADRVRVVLEDAVAVYSGSEYCIIDGERCTISDSGEKTIYEDGTVMVPMEFVKCLGWNSKKAYISRKEISGIEYVSFGEAADLNGLDAVVSEGFAIASKKEDLTLFNGTNKLNPYSACAAQMVGMGEVTVPESQPEDYRYISDSIRQGLTDKTADEIRTIAEEAEKQLEFIRQDSKTPFRDLPFDKAEDTAEAYARVEKLASAYAIEGSKYYKSEELKTIIYNALEYLYENYCGISQLNGKGITYRMEADKKYIQAYVPYHLANTLVLMAEDIARDDVLKYLSYYTQKGITFIENENTAPVSASAVILTGALTENPQMISYGRGKLIEQLLYADAERTQDTQPLLMESLHYQHKERRIAEMPQYVRANTKTLGGQGIMSDGSYIAGGAHGENGSRGLKLIELLSVAKTLSGTSYKLDKFTGRQIYDTIANAYYPFVYNGKMMRAVTGNDGTELEEKAKMVLAYMLDAVELVPDEYVPKLKGMIKAIYGQYGADENFGLNSKRTELLNGIVSDEAVTAENSVSNKMYSRMDKMLQSSDSYSVAISMSSKRIFDYDSTECKNLNGWYLGSGMTTVYAKGDNDSFSDTYWSGVDPYRLPGTTVMLTERVTASIRNGQEYQSKSDFVGGATNGVIGVSAMTVSPYIVKDMLGTGELGTATAEGVLSPANIDLSAKKAWFTFDKEIVALGTGISGTGNDEVITTVDNRLKSTAVTSGLNWKHYSGSGEYGYYFPQTVTLEEAESDGYWKLWLSHGVNPKNASYAYVILPGMTRSETQNYAKTPEIEILSNNIMVQAVRNKRTGIKSYVFYEPCEFDIIKVSEPVIAMLESKGDAVKLYLSDPTQTLGKAKITLSGKYTVNRSDFADVSVKSGKTEITVDFDGSRGKTLEIELKKI